MAKVLNPKIKMTLSYIESKIALYSQIPIYPKTTKLDRTRLSDRSAFLCEDDKCNVSWIDQESKDSFLNELIQRKNNLAGGIE